MEVILCPTDFSPAADNAVFYADELAQRLDPRLVLFHNIYDPEAPEFANYGSGPFARPAKDIVLEGIQLKKLAAIKNTLETTDWGMPVQYDIKISHGLTKETVPVMVREEHADLVVIGNQSKDNLQKVFVGSMAADLIKNSPCPVLLIPPKVTFKPFRKIVFATDLHGESFLDMHLVLKLAGLFEAEIIFLHVETNPTPEYETFREDEIIRMKKRLPYKNVTFYKESNLNIEEGINQFCQRHHADMLVIGYHPHPFWQDLFAEVHAQEMAYNAKLPLLVIHNRN